MFRGFIYNIVADNAKGGQFKPEFADLTDELGNCAWDWFWNGSDCEHCPYWCREGCYDNGLCEVPTHNPWPTPEIENEEVQEDDDVVRDELLTPRLAGVETDWPNNSCDVLAEINHLRTDPKGFSDQYLVPMLENFSPYDYGG